MIKALSEPEPKPKPEPKLKPTPKPKIIINKKKLEEIRKDFNELRHRFSKKEAFYDIKNYKHLSISEIKKASKNLTKLKKSLRFKKFHGNIDSVDYEDLDNYDDNYDFADDDEYRKIGSIRALFKEFDSDYYKPIRTDDGFTGRRNNYIEYKSRRDRYENVSPKEYLKMVRPYLRDLINEHKPIDESNDEPNDDDDTDHAEWKIQLSMQNSCISTRHFEETCNIYSKSEPVEFLWVVTQKMSLMHFLIHFYKDFNMHKKHQMIKEANLFLKVLNYYIIIFKE